EADISFISDWIDDGCPAADHQITFGVDGTVTETTLEELDESNVEPAARRYEVYEGSPNEYSYKYGELKQRTNLDCMSETEHEKLRWPSASFTASTSGRRIGAAITTSP